MAVSRMNKINILGLSEEKDQILKILQDKELVQITNVETTLDFFKYEESKKDEIDNKLKDLSFVIDFLSEFEEKKKGMFAVFNPEIVSKEKFEKILDEIDIDKICEDVQTIYRREGELKSEIQHLENEILNLQDWENLDIKLNQLGEIGYTTRYLVKIIPPLFKKHEEELKNSECVYYETIKERNDNYYIFVLVHNDFLDSCEDILKKANYETVALEEYNGTVRELISDYKKQISEKKNKIKEFARKAKEYVEKYHDLKLAYDYLNSQYYKEEAKESILNSKYTFLIDGWIPEKKVDDLNEALKKFNDIDISLRKPEKEEQPPIEYENKPYASPYEMIVSMYSPPGYREVDPSPLIMPFFTLFFAVCLTDAGYGLIIALFSIFLLMKIPKQKKSMRKMFKVLLFSGLTTVVVGLLTGGIFGIDFGISALKSTTLAKIRNALVLFDPSTSSGMMTFFVVSLGLGWIHVFCGQIVGFFSQKKSDGLMPAIYDKVSWMIIMIGVLFSSLTIVKPMFKVNLVVPASFSDIGLIFMAIGGAIILLFGGRSAKTIIGKFGSGLFELYGISGILGDILSYARLFALGLATGVIAGVFNQLALMLKGIGGVPGWILFVILLIIGHVFNIAMNALGAFIHTLRLQFVEFFTKFYEGGGEEFKPLKRELKYVMVEKENIQ